MEEDAEDDVKDIYDVEDYTKDDAEDDDDAEEGEYEDRVVDLLEEDVSGLVPMVVDETGGSILDPCGGCRHDVTGLHCYPEFITHIHVFRGDVGREEGPGCWCPRCRQ